MSTTKAIQAVGAPFIKFQDRDKIEYFQNGKIYFKSLAYYRQRERETGDDTVGDVFEAMFHVNNGFLCIPEIGVFKKLDDALIHSCFANHYVFCMLSLFEDKPEFKFTNEQKEKILGFGDSALLITNRSEFLHRVAMALDREKIEGTHGFVNYYDEASDNSDYWFSILRSGPQNIAFSKRKRYSYQQEYRLLIKPATTETDYFELDIGNIADISTILTADQAINAIALCQGSV